MKAPKRAKTEPSISSGCSLVLNAGLPFRLEGIYGEGVISAFNARSNGTGEVPPPRYPLKKGGFLGVPGASPGLNLITLQHRKST